MQPHTHVHKSPVFLRVKMAEDIARGCARMTTTTTSFNMVVQLIECVHCHAISNGNRTEWSPIRSVIIRVITNSDDHAAGVRFVYHEYDYRPNWTTRSPIIN